MAESYTTKPSLVCHISVLYRSWGLVIRMADVFIKIRKKVSASVFQDSVKRLSQDCFDFRNTVTVAFCAHLLNELPSATPPLHRHFQSAGNVSRVKNLL